MMRREGGGGTHTNNIFHHLFHHHHHHHHHQSEFSPSSSFSNGFYSSEEGGCSPYAAPSSTPFDGDANVNDDLGLAECFYKMHIVGEEHGGFGGPKRRGFGLLGGSGGGGGFLGGTNTSASASPWNVESYGLYESLKNNINDFEAFHQPSGYGVRGRFDGGVNEAALLGLHPRFSLGDSTGSYDSFRNHLHPNALYPCGPSSNISGGKVTEQGDGMYLRRNNPSVSRPCIDDDYFFLELHGGTESNGGKGLMYPMGMPHEFSSVAQLDVDNLSHSHSLFKQRMRMNPGSGVPECFNPMKCRELEGFSSEDGFMYQGKRLNHAMGKGSKSSSKGNKKGSCNKKAMQEVGDKSSRLDSGLCDGGVSRNECSESDTSSLRTLLNINSLAEVQGYMYFIAKDQYGCRFLQRMLDEGTCQDVQLIFDQIINHALELMTNPFGNYLMQKLMDVCNEHQRMQFVLKVTQEPGQLVRASLDTHGTRVVQKLIETVKTGKQISLVKSSLECGFLDLIKDPNGNHVVQRCLDCFNNEDNRFIFDAAARFCVEIATQRHGCCVLQKCVAHAMGRNRDKLINEIARNGLFLSQDPYGNYVVQYVIELKIPSAMAKLINQLKGHFVRLSMQKCSSHVVEKCLKYFEEGRSKIINELLSVPRFEQLLQDPYANYVIQSALTVTKGHLHASLVEAVKPHTILRTSPYCKRIFKRELLKK